MRTKRSAASGRSISGFFVFLLVGMFAVFSLLLVLIGAGVYRGIAEKAECNAQSRTSLSYVASKIRAGDAAGAISVEYVDGAPVLLLEEKYEDELLQTRIYYLPDEDGQGGALYELFSIGSGGIPELDTGERIAEISAFDVREVDGRLELRVTMRNGSGQSMRLRQRAF